ncbi:MAG: radical SAM protein [Puniceicoccales bacterium]|jgi:nitrogen fixation protein NifB|nr:radical SAM protein [Puniceicoccales bacterium]
MHLNLSNLARAATAAATTGGDAAAADAPCSPLSACGFEDSAGAAAGSTGSTSTTPPPNAPTPEEVALDFTKHPCFNRSSHHTHGRIHLPVAPRCNLQCNFCNRKFDCMNESRPGVTSAVLAPERAADYLDDVLGRHPNIAVTGIAGPGDPFANADETLSTLEHVRRRHPKMLLCLASNGLGIGPHIATLAELRVSHVTLTINAVDPLIGAKVYAWIRDGHHPMRGIPAAQTLLDKQLAAIRALKAAGIVVKVNFIIIPGVNDQHVEDVARTVGALGADIMNCMAFMPVAGAAFEDLPEPDAKLVAGSRLKAGRHLPQMTHCARCRADAVGLINEGISEQNLAALARFANGAGGAGDAASRPFVAVASQEGMLVNQHLGEAARVLVFKRDAGTASGYKYVEVRRTPEPGGGPSRWAALADTLRDCRALLVSAAGPQPKRALEERGVRVVEMEGMLEEGLDAIFNDRPIPAALARRFTSCGIGCKGTGTGCG